MLDHHPLDYRGTRAVPLVLYPAGGALPAPPPLDRAARRALLAAVAAIGAVATELAGSTSRRDGRLDAGVTRLTAATGTVVGALAPWLPDVAGGNGGNGAPEPHDVYMGVRRACLTPAAMAAETAVVAHRALADLAHAQLDLNDVIAEAEAVAAMLGRLATGPALHAGAAPPSPAPGRLGRHAYLPGGEGLQRWVLVHHLYGLLHLHLAERLEAAAAALDAGDPDAAAAALEQAAPYLRGTTAAMFHAAAVPAAYYRAVIRPTMCPPATPFNLGGSMNAENTATRKALARVLERCPEPYGALAARHQRLASARDALLGLDLLDIERHVGVAAVMVGDERSLLQPDSAPDNAAGILRLLRHGRAVRYGPLMRFGDRAVAAAERRPERRGGRRGGPAELRA